MNNLTVIRGKVGGDNGRKRGKGHQGPGITDTWTKPKKGRIEGGRWEWLEWGRSSGGNMETSVLEQQ